MKRSFLLAGAWLGLAVIGSSSDGSIKAEKIHVAEPKKMAAYVRDGLIVGGDRAVNDVSVKEIRWGRGAGFERIVMDLTSHHGGEPMAIDRPPFYQVSVAPDEGRLTVTIFGRPRLEFNPERVVASLRKSPLIKNVQLLPRVEDESWTFAMDLNRTPSVEVFELRIQLASSWI